MNNIGKIKQALKDKPYAAMLITGQASRLFTGGFNSSAGAFLITQSDAWFFVDPRYFEMAKNKIADAEILLVHKDTTFPKMIGEKLNELGVPSVGFEDGYITYAGYKEWADQFNVTLEPAQSLMTELRAVKTRKDLDGMTRSQRIAEKAFEEILPLISRNITEKELATELVYRMMKNGADDKGFDPIIVSGPRSSLPHGVPTDEKIADGFLTIDFGVKCDGWISDCTRTLCIGQPTDEMVKVYETVLSAQEAGIKAIRGGVSCKDVDTAARDVIENAGYGDYFGHGLGHCIGLEVHEWPRASQLSKDVFPIGAVLTVEPGIYLPGRFGVRIEDTVYITENGCENITKLPKNLMII
ncbi:MAG: aminopeptidase P family protein [Oscillospiraceae bacterium]|nr:aminopeptidase P family protein [Oscillospiraceae bacterium]